MNVVVIGGGIIGCAVGYELASRGAQVQIFDPRGMGRGATYASAGVLAPYIEGHSEPILRLTECGLAHYDRFVARVASDANRPIEFRRPGTLQVADDEHQASGLAAAAQRLAAAGVPHAFIDGAEARRLEPGLGDAVVAALEVPQHGYVAVAALMAALVEASARHGLVMTNARVERIRAGDRGVRVHTTRGTIEADAIVIAAGSWSAEVVPVAAVPPLRPIRGQLLHVRCGTSPLSRVVWGTSTYLVPWQDGTVLIGATSEDVGFDERPTVDGVSGLLAGAIALVPSIGSAEFADVRVGLRPLTSDQLPLIGASSTMPGVYYATGHYRNGVLLAPLTAALLADLMLDGCARAELALTRPDRFGL